jgi:hypothetical protein
MGSINSRLLTPMKKGAEWIMMISKRILKAGINAAGVLVDESKTNIELYEKFPTTHYKRSGLIHKCLVRNDGAVRRVVVRLLNARGKEHEFLE